ncbi:MAG: hypothetical protein ACPGYV_12230 [Phycisphaeraceae bacterium]
MLVAGVILGVLLGPAALGRLAPQIYDPLFLGSGDTVELDAAIDALDRFHNDDDLRQARIDSILEQSKLLGEGDSAQVSAQSQIAALVNDFADEQQRLENAVDLARVPVLANRQQHRDKLLGMATMMILLIVVILVAEAILSPQRDEIEQGQATLPPALSRLVTVRYGLASGWLMLMLAQPVWLKNIDLVFGTLLLVIVLLAGLTPLGKKTTA